MNSPNEKLARYIELGEMIASFKAERDKIKAEVKANGGEIETDEFVARLEHHPREKLESISEFKRKLMYGKVKSAGLVHNVRVTRMLVRRKA